jgi:enolase
VAFGPRLHAHLGRLPAEPSRCGRLGADKALRPMSDTRVVSVHGRRVWDSRGRPTVEADIVLECGAVGRAIAPAGASIGISEAFELRDGGAKFGGYDVARAVAHVRGEIAQAIIGSDVADQAALDARLIALDGSPSKSRLGGNALIAVSMAAAHAAAAAMGQPLYYALGGLAATTLPLPHIQIFGGAAHGAVSVDIQDLMVVCPAAKNFAEALDWAAEVYRAAGALMKQTGTLQGVTNSGGWWPAFRTNEHGLEAVVRAIEHAGFVAGRQVGISLDVAASQFGHGGQYRLTLEGKEFDSEGLIKLLLRWIKRYPILSIEDPLADDDYEGFVAFTRAAGNRVQIVGDDFLTSQTSQAREAALRGAVNAVMLKSNQRGTLTETREAWRATQQAGLAGIVSSRSGETEDVTIVHLAVGWGVGQLKVGGFARGERTAKWNEALRIEEALGARARFAGADALRRAKRTT